MFKLVSKFSPAGDQNEAIDKLVDGLNNHEKAKFFWGPLVLEKPLQLLML